jgi:hypothetical protein
MSSRFARFWTKWKTWGLPAFVSALTPWFARLIKIELISDFYQPGLGSVATLLGATGAMVGVALLMGTTRERQRRGMLRGLWLLIPSFVICLVFALTVGHIWTFEPVGSVLIHSIWILAYIGIFVGLGWIIGIAYLLLISA